MDCFDKLGDIVCCMTSLPFFINSFLFYSLLLSPLFLNISDLYPTNLNPWLLTKSNTACTEWVYDADISNHKSLQSPGGISRCYTIMLQFSSQQKCLQINDSIWLVKLWNITLLYWITSEKITVSKNPEECKSDKLSTMT